MDNKVFYIRKASGEIEEFSLEKYVKSLERAGLSKNEVLEILRQIKPKLYNKITTRELYELTHSQILKRSTKCASLYSLKDAIRKLGPSGFPFEQLVANILRDQSYSVETNQILQGKCVLHEVDIIAIKNKKKLFIEAKFHAPVGHKVDLKIALYVKSVFDDLTNNKSNAITGCLIVTNVKFTSQVIRYAKCVNIDLIAWGYPPNRGIDSLINKCALYPITVLSFLKNQDKNKLINENIIFCKDVLKNQKKIKSIGIDDKTAQKLELECSKLLG